MDKMINRYFCDLRPMTMAQQVSGLTFSGKVNRIYNENGSFFVKQANNSQIIPAVASSRMYNAIGINTPLLYVAKSKKLGYTKTIEKEVGSIKNLVCELAGSNVQFAKIETKAFGKDKWALFYDDDLIRQLLKFMLPECLEALKDLFLVDELRTDVDRHINNYFFYKLPEDERYRGIIAIELEQMVIYKYCGEGRGSFESFLYYPYQSATPQQVSDELCYLQRIRNVRNLINEGYLSTRNINIMKRALEYDFPGEVDCVAREAGVKYLERKCLVKPIEKLWDYNRKTIGRELGL